MQGLLATFLFAILTNRTLLVPRDEALDESLLCDPFDRSSWYLQSDHQREILAALEAHKTNPVDVANSLAPGNTVDMAKLYTRYDASSMDESFFCESGQRAIENVTWVMLSHSRFFSMTFSTIAPFRKEMERLFPDRIIFTRLARYLLHPKNVLWDGITRAYKAHLMHADKLVGVQVRTFTTGDDWAVPRVLHCLNNVSREVLPAVRQDAWSRWINSSVEHVVDRSSNPTLVKVYVASMHKHHLERLQAEYASGIAKDGSVVVFHSETNIGFEQWSVEQHALALHDVWLLSFSHVLLTSSHSTFGYLSAGLAGIRPYVLNIAQPDYGFEKDDPERSWRTNGRPVCTLSPSLEPCGRAALTRPCRSEDEKSAPSYLSKTCSVDVPKYWQLLSQGP